MMKLKKRLVRGFRSYDKLQRIDTVPAVPAGRGAGWLRRSGRGRQSGFYRWCSCLSAKGARVKYFVFSDYYLS